jgi:transposase-like protein
MRESVKEKKVQKRYDEEFKRQAVELVIHSGRSQAQIARELGVSPFWVSKEALVRGIEKRQVDAFSASFIASRASELRSARCNASAFNPR